MSITAARPAHTVDRSIVPQTSDGRKIVPRQKPPPFVRKPSAPGGAAPAGPVQSVGPTPLKPLATALCRACTGLRRKLEAEGVSNPVYLGSDNGGWVYSDPETEQSGIRNLNLGKGPFGLLDFGNTCVIKPDGRVIFKGETLDAGHPDLPDVAKALEKVLRKVSEGSLKRGSFIGGNTLQPPWDPGTLHYAHYEK